MGARELLATCRRDAIVSECGQFRYWLSRFWRPGRRLLYVMLNPSTADASVDDATIRRCTTFADAQSFGSFEVVNLFAFRATKPTDLSRLGWQVGPLNDEHIDVAARNADAICVAWGAIGERGPAVDRMQVVAPILRRAGHELQCLKATRSGHPQHPLYLPNSCRLRPFEAAIEEAMHG